MMKGHLRKPVQKLLLALKSSLEKQMTTGDLQREAKGQVVKNTKYKFQLD